MWCWGDDSGHQTSRRDTTWAEAPRALSLPPGAGAVRSLSVEGSQSCVATRTGAIYCWGLDSAGPQIGHHTYIFGVREVPTLVEGVTGAAQVVSGGVDVCALGAQGEVACWGGNLGRISTTEDSGGFRVPQTIALPNTRALSLAWGTACAVDASGAVRCTGSNVDGVRGDSEAHDEQCRQHNQQNINKRRDRYVNE